MSRSPRAVARLAWWWSGDEVGGGVSASGWGKVVSFSRLGRGAYRPLPPFIPSLSTVMTFSISQCPGFPPAPAGRGQGWAFGADEHSLESFLSFGTIQGVANLTVTLPVSVSTRVHSAQGGSALRF